MTRGKALVKKHAKENKVDYIDLNMAIYRKDHKKISNKQLNFFMDQFIEMIEADGMLCGGSAKVKRE